MQFDFAFLVVQVRLFLKYLKMVHEAMEYVIPHMVVIESCNISAE